MRLGRWVVALVACAASSAHAYGFMLRHDYTGCAQCHVDPAGGSVLTPYGRAQGEVLLRTRYGSVTEEEPGPQAGFLFGLFQPPENLHLGGDVRVAFSSGAGFQTPRVFPMQADVVGAVTSGALRASMSLGLGSRPTALATVVGDQVALVSRHHWVGYSPDEDQAFMVRAGRFNLPFGVRIPEHTTWARALTATDLNVAQQHGVSVGYSGERLRTEVMGIVGNLQLSPRAFRERGYAGFVEVIPTPWLTVGGSSLLTHAEADLLDPERAVWRHAHGLFTRLSPWKPVVLSLEGDFVLRSRKGVGGDWGVVALAHLDVEPLQGLHLVGVGELSAPSFTAPPSLGGWAGVWWFFAPHADLRVDVIARQTPGEAPSVSLLAQLHLFL